jgi:MSHA biogenesis protein MshQ
MSYATPPSLTITARNALGKTVQNYTGNFMRLTSTAGGSVLFAAPNTDGIQVGADGINYTEVNAQLYPNLNDILDNADGSLTYSLSPLDSFTYVRNANAQIGPYMSDIDLLLTAITDGDGISDEGAPVSLTPLGVEIRFGRLLVDDAYGPQTDDLIVRVRAESFDGSGFIDNPDDYCTQLAPTHAISLGNWQAQLSSGETQVIGSSGLLAGSGEIVLSAPGIGSVGDTNDGSVDLTLDLSLTSLPQSWLFNDEDSDGVYAENPLGTASFGMYRGDDRFLYWRETP